MIKARLGGTSYELHEGSPGILRIVRQNSDGAKEFFVAKELFDNYAREKFMHAAGTIADNFSVSFSNPVLCAKCGKEKHPGEGFVSSDQGKMCGRCWSRSRGRR